MKKIAGTILVLIILGMGGYYYMTHFYGVKDYSSIKADYTFTNDNIKNEFTTNESTANTKYVNKAVIVTGSVTENTGASINFSGVTCKMTTPENTVKIGDNIKIQGRLVGYDSLLEEVQLDQCSIIK